MTRTPLTFGLFLNAGAQLGPTHAEVFDFTLKQADLAERLGYRDLWVTEHHFIDFGVNPSALGLAGFLLGRTRRVRVGTAVTLSPLYHPVQLAEQAALLDNLSGGRFDFGIGRGGYMRDYEVFGLDHARWDDEVENTARVALDCWTQDKAESAGRWNAFTPVGVNPRPLTRPHPPLFLATSTPSAVRLAAERGLPLLHYFATPLEGRVKLEATWSEARPADAPAADHVHALIVLVADDEADARARLAHALTASFDAGEHPHVPQAANRHVGPDGRPFDRSAMAAMVAQSSPVGPPGRVAEQIAAFCAATGARRLALYMEAVADPALTLASIERFPAEVAPLLADRHGLDVAFARA